MAQTISYWLLALALVLAIGGIPIILMWTKGRAYSFSRTDDPPERKRLAIYLKVIGVLLLLIGVTIEGLRWFFPP
jgi:hypothetical protein